MCVFPIRFNLHLPFNSGMRVAPFAEKLKKRGITTAQDIISQGFTTASQLSGALGLPITLARAVLKLLKRVMTRKRALTRAHMIHSYNHAPLSLDVQEQGEDENLDEEEEYVTTMDNRMGVMTNGMEHIHNELSDDTRPWTRRVVSEMQRRAMNRPGTAEYVKWKEDGAKWEDLYRTCRDWDDLTATAGSSSTMSITQ